MVGAGNASSVKWKNVGAAIEKLVVWDSVYYLRIAECGYEYEQTHAFFPALPFVTRFLANNGKVNFFFSCYLMLWYCYPVISLEIGNFLFPPALPLQNDDVICLFRPIHIASSENKISYMRVMRRDDSDLCELSGLCKFLRVYFMY